MMFAILFREYVPHYAGCSTEKILRKLVLCFRRTRDLLSMRDHRDRIMTGKLSRHAAMIQE